jgi:hypothetical protein
MTLPSGSWEKQVRLIDVYAVGEAGLVPLEAATAKFEAHAMEAARELSGESEALPPRPSTPTATPSECCAASSPRGRR